MKTMMTGKMFCLALMLMATSSATAQDLSPEEALQKINKVKLDGGYVWAEGTSQKSKKEALENAETVLAYEIRGWLKDIGKGDAEGVVMPTSDETMKVETVKRKLYRAFVYVEKSKIVPYGKNDNVVVMKVDEQKPKEKAKGKKSDKAENTTASMEPIYAPTPLEQEMLEVKTFDGIQPFLTRKNINTHGKYKTRPETGMYYIFIYNKERQVPACLKHDQGRLVNVATGKEDPFENYKGCGGYWFVTNSSK